MLKLSRKMRYALEAVVDIAYNARAEPVQSKEITRRQGIPQRYLEHVMQSLVRARILKGVRGPRGGYHLARERRRITVGEIVRVVGELENDAGVPAEEGERSALGREVVDPMIDEVRDMVMEKLESITLEDLCNDAREAGIRRDRGPRADFTI